MNPEDIKKGTHVFIPGVVDREPEGEYLYVTYKCGRNRNGLEYFRRDDAAKLLIFHPINGIKNSEPAPKYDPCRLFRKGDRVKTKKLNSRWGHELDKVFQNKILRVREDEGTEHGWSLVSVETEDGKSHWNTDANYLELVTPVEELEPYCVVDNKNSKSVEVRRINPERVVASFYWGGEAPAYTQEEARKAAEAECARLNEEYRKENA